MSYFHIRNLMFMAYFVCLTNGGHPDSQLILSSTKGYIRSPGFPKYPDSYTEREWVILAGSGQTVSLVFRNMSMPPSDDHSRCPNGHVMYGTFSRQGLKVFNSGKLCGSSVPPPFVNTGRVWLSFTSGRHANDTAVHLGFVVSYQVFRTRGGRPIFRGRYRTGSTITTTARTSTGESRLNVSTIIGSACAPLPVLVALAIFGICWNKRKKKTIGKKDQSQIDRNTNFRSPPLPVLAKRTYRIKDKVPDAAPAITTTTERHDYEELSPRPLVIHSITSAEEYDYAVRPQWENISTLTQNVGSTMEGQGSAPHYISFRTSSNPTNSERKESFASMVELVTTIRHRVASAPPLCMMSTPNADEFSDLPQHSKRIASDNIPRIVVGTYGSPEKASSPGSVFTDSPIRKSPGSVLNLYVQEPKNSLNDSFGRAPSATTKMMVDSKTPKSITTSTLLSPSTLLKLSDAYDFVCHDNTLDVKSKQTE